MNAITEILPAEIDFTAIKTKQNAAWASGDYSKIGVTLQMTGELLAEALDLPVDATVLDVAAGNGNATLAFARRGCDVISSDFVDTLLVEGQRRAEAENLGIRHQIADAEMLPFESGTFDAVVSTFGVMFTPNQQAAANELVRVCRSRGKIGLANWTPDGFIGALFKTLGRHVPPPAGVKSPALWGNTDWITDTFGTQSVDIETTTRHHVFRFRSPAHFVDFFRTWYGPVHKAFAALDDAGKEALEADILSTVARFNTCTNGQMRVPSEYVELVITKR